MKFMTPRLNGCRSRDFNCRTYGYESSEEGHKQWISMQVAPFLARFPCSGARHHEHRFDPPSAIPQICLTRMCLAKIGKVSGCFLRLFRKRAGRRGRENAEKSAFRCGMQSLCGLSGGQGRLVIALPQRLSGGPAQDVGVSRQQHQRGEVCAATRAAGRTA